MIGMIVGEKPIGPCATCLVNTMCMKLCEDLEDYIRNTNVIDQRTYNVVTRWMQSRSPLYSSEYETYGRKLVMPNGED